MQFGKIEIASYNFALFSLYFLLVLFIGLQLGRIVYYRHKILSFQVGFLVQCFLLALLRSVFFLIFDYVKEIIWLNLVTYWIPINIQFSTFSLLVVYYAHLQHKQKVEWYTFKRKYVTVWAVTNVLFLLLAVLWIVLGIKFDTVKGKETAWLDKIHGYFTGTVFFLLVVILAWYTWKVSRLMKTARGTQTKLLAKVAWNKILIVALCLFFLFTSRTLYDFITAVDENLSVDVDSGSTAAAMFTFIAFSLWEIIPIILVLVLFGNVNATTLGAFSKISEPKKVNTFIRPKKIVESQDSVLKAQIFNDPRRYDSDDENTPLHRGSSPLFGYYGANSPYLATINSSINSSTPSEIIIQQHNISSASTPQ